MKPLALAMGRSHVNFGVHFVRFTPLAQALPPEALRRTWGPLRGKGTLPRARQAGGECTRLPRAHGATFR